MCGGGGLQRLVDELDVHDLFLCQQEAEEAREHVDKGHPQCHELPLGQVEQLQTRKRRLLHGGYTAVTWRVHGDMTVPCRLYLVVACWFISQLSGSYTAAT